MDKAQRIQALNDVLRRSFVGGKVVMTSALASRDEAYIANVLTAVRQFNSFNANNDPYNEHDLGVFDHKSERIMWKIDYYDKAMEYGSEDPANPDVTTRVLTIGFAIDF
jgi:hypothetical protein